MSQWNDPAAAAPSAVAIDLTALQALVQALTTALSNGLVDSTTTTKYSTSIDPYNTNSMDVEKKDENNQWAVITKMMDGWKLVTANLENAENLMDLFKDHQTQFGLDPLLMVPTAVTGTIKAIPCTIFGQDYWDTGIANFKSVLVNIQMLSLDQVRAWNGWFWGGEFQELRISYDMLIKSIYPNEGNNHFQLIATRFDSVDSPVRFNSLPRTTSSAPDITTYIYARRFFEYINESTVRRIVYGLIFFKLSMAVMKPQLLVDHSENGKELKEMTPPKYGNYFFQLLTLMQEKKNEIDTLRKDGVEFDDRRFLALIFDCLALAKSKDFRADVKRKESAWVKYPATIDIAKIIDNTTNLYTNYKYTGEWDDNFFDKY